MRTRYKILTGVIAIILGLFVAAHFILPVFLKSSNFRNKIDQMVYDKTGRHLYIKSAPAVSIFPWVGISLKDITITSPKPFEKVDFAHVDQIKIKMAVFPLLTGNVKINNIVLDGAKINLIKNKQGETNYQQWRNKPDQEIETAPVATSNPPQSTAEATETNAPATSAQTGKADTPKRKELDFKISKLQITNSAVNYQDNQNDKFFEINAFNLAAKKINPNSPFPLTTNFTVKESKNISAKIKSEAIININNHGDIITASAFKTTIDLQRKDLPLIPIVISGDIALQNHTQANFNPMAIQIANLKTSGKLSILDLNNPSIKLQIKSEKTDLDELVNTLRGSSFIKGTLQFDSTLSTTLVNKKSLLQNLNGSGKFEIKDGALLGISLNNFISQAATILGFPATGIKPSKTKETKFKEVSGTYTIDNGVLKNNDLKLDAEHFTAAGYGSINLPQQTIQYTLTPSYIHPKTKAEISLPILISGNMNKPSIKPDYKALGENPTIRKIKDKIKIYTKDIGSKIGDLFGK